MKLYGSYTSPFVRHCRIALAQGGFDFALVDTGYTESAENSPTAKVPFFSDGDLQLSDSSSILKYVREKSARQFLAEHADFELYTMANTILDATINLFLLANEGFGPDQVPYLGRQQFRVDKGIKELNSRIDPEQGIATDSALRCACYVDWAIFRNRADFTGQSNLLALLDAANSHEVFASTAPPR